MTLPYRRTHTGQVVGGCFQEEERWPAHACAHTQTQTHRWIFPYLLFTLAGSQQHRSDSGTSLVKNNPQVSYTNITTSLSNFSAVPTNSNNGHWQWQSKTHKYTRVAWTIGKTTFFLSLTIKTRDTELHTHHNDVLMVLSAQVRVLWRTQKTETI